MVEVEVGREAISSCDTTLVLDNHHHGGGSSCPLSDVYALNGQRGRPCLLNDRTTGVGRWFGQDVSKTSISEGGANHIRYTGSLNPAEEVLVIELPITSKIQIRGCSIAQWYTIRH